ncbi:MAG: hypothetical protein H0X27_10180 [Caulobacteraceae bacterium]|nr:hypothetical protein [Caulobacteraceae bacterium]
MTRTRLWASLILILVVVAGVAWAWWNFDLRWRPRVIAKDQAQIARILDTARWVSPGGRGNRLYMVAYRDCPSCLRFETLAFPKLRAAGVDLRVIMIARADTNGLIQSTPAERATVAELWLNRDWRLFERWMAAAPAEAWTAPGLAPADGDVSRTAVIQAGRAAVEALRPLLKANGLEFAYPTLIWWTKAGVMHGCACQDPRGYGPVERELGA